MASFNLRDKELRRKFREWLAYMDMWHGLLCFCRTWRNPVMWAHYAKNHTGVCYGFDVDPRIFVDVRYVSERLYPNLTLENFLEHVGEDQMVDLFATKFIHWGYEEEVRLLIKMSERVGKNELVFHNFSDFMKLKEVILGPRCKISIQETEAVTSNNDVSIFKARLAFQRFEVVRQKNKALW